MTSLSLDATCRVEPKRGRVRALQSRIPNAAGATGRVARPVKYGGDNGKPWRGALFHRARRTRLGDDGNQIGAHSALRNRNSALERLLSGIHFGMDDWGKFASCSKLNWGDNSIMSAAEVIEQIKELPANERAQVTKFVVENDDSWIPESFKQGMADAAAGRFVDMEMVLSGAPPPSRKRRK